MYNLRRRLDASITSVTVSMLMLQQSVTEIPFRFIASEDTFEAVQREQSEVRAIAAGYVLSHPWKVLFSTAYFDQEFWEMCRSTWNTSKAMAR